MRPPTHRILAILTLTALLALAGAPATAAQDDEQLNLSGAIFTGPCDTLADTATHPAGDFIEVDEDAIIGYQQVPPFLRAQATLPAGLDTLFQPQQVYSYVVRDNADPTADPVACGELGGVQVNGQVVIGLYQPDPASPDDPAAEVLVGVAVFGNTTPSGPTTQPSNAQSETPVQAYLYENVLAGIETPTPMAPSPPPPPTPTPTTAPASPTTAPTEAPTTMPTTTTTATATETATATATATETATSTEEPTEQPTDEPTSTADATAED
jgi:hypothetical protein